MVHYYYTTILHYIEPGVHAEGARLELDGELDRLLLIIIIRLTIIINIYAIIILTIVSV